MLKLNIYILSGAQSTSAWLDHFHPVSNPGTKLNPEPARDQAAVLTRNAVQEFKPGWLLSRLRYILPPADYLGISEVSSQSDFLRAFYFKVGDYSFEQIGKGETSPSQGKGILQIRVFWNPDRCLIYWKNLLLYFLLCLFQRQGNNNNKYFHSLIHNASGV